ncbi:hypothetical protein AB0L40_26040, partial [Patulibacter sp. NPDC049589]|uniref:hypothetical protein n=1 Tax=Patulibacter sp. NPDC049589 TaxID=3154731 RepID=UPI00341A38E0
AGIAMSGESRCGFGPKALFAQPLLLSRVSTSIGPVPVTLTVDGQVFLSGSSSTFGHLATAARGDVRGVVRTVYDGLRATRTGRLTTRLRPHDTTVAASGGAQVGLSSTVGVRVFGLAGPDVDLGAGARTISDVARSAGEPWWRTTVPDELGTTFALQAWRADLQEPRVRLAGHEDELARASRPPGGSSVSPPAAAPDPLPDGAVARVRWDSAATVDVHAWDLDGHHASGAAPLAVPGATVRSGYQDGVPTVQLDAADPGRPLTLGLCLADGSEAAVTVDVRAGDGSTVRRTVVLRGRRAGSLAAVSPEGGPAFTPPGDWCGLPTGDPIGLGQLTDGIFSATRARTRVGVNDAPEGRVRQTDGVTFSTQVVR